jgi:hypothetical protein
VQPGKAENTWQGQLSWCAIDCRMLQSAEKKPCLGISNSISFKLLIMNTAWLHTMQMCSTTNFAHPEPQALATLADCQQAPDAHMPRVLVAANQPEVHWYLVACNTTQSVLAVAALLHPKTSWNITSHM